MTSPLLVFGEDWGAHPSSTQHIIRRLMPDHPVVWVNSIGLRRPKLNFQDVTRVLAKVKSVFRSRPTKPSSQDHVVGLSTVISPLVIPVPRNKLERTINSFLLGPKVRKALKEASKGKPIFWTSLPTAIDLTNCSENQAVVYYCGDDFSGLAGVDHSEVAQAEKRLVERADLILASSERLVAKFPPAKTVYIPHGVDTKLFSTSMAPPADLPKERPVAGFYGSISDWLDVSLMNQVVTALPNWEFVFIGSVQTDIAALSHQPNVSFLGPRDHHSLPGYAQNWTVSLLPFKNNAQIRACNPLKLREYLSAGTPIVSTDFPALDGYRDLLTVADTADDFVHALIKSVSEPSHLKRQRQNRVAHESWDQRAQQISKLLASL